MPTLRTFLLVLLLSLLTSSASSVALAHPLFQVPRNVTPIYQIQGNGLATPLQGRYLDTYGVVTGLVPNGFYLQDPVGDDDPTTSDGIYVYTNKPPTVQLGDCVQLQRAYVDEFYEKTELSRLKRVQPVDYCATSQVQPVVVPLPRLATAPATLYEPFEGMLVQISGLIGIVQGPTKRFESGDAEITLLPEALFPYVLAGRVYQEHSEQMNALIYLGAGLGAQLPDAGFGDRVTVGNSTGVADEPLVTTAILDYNFGKYQLLPLRDQTITVEDTFVATPESGVAATAQDFTVCSVNLFALGKGSAQHPDEVDYLASVRKRALAIATSLQGCTIIGLQETGTPADAENLAAELQSQFNLSYTVAAIPGPQSGNPEFPLTLSLLARVDRAQIVSAEARQGCSPQQFDVEDDLGVCPAGEFALFNRPPLVVTVTVQGDWGAPFALTLIDNHWKSKGGDETVNVVQRKLQARHVARLVQELVTNDPATNIPANVIVLGDLNDYYTSEAVALLRTGVEPPLVHSYDLLPPLARYTYVFNGGNQVLDHLLVTPNLLPLIASVDIVHINTSFPYPTHVDFTTVQHASDHDPVQLLLRPSGAAILGGNLTFANIQVQLLDATQTLVGEAITDEMGDFRLWNLPPGDYTLQLITPTYLHLSPAKLPLSLPIGYTALPAMAAAHDTLTLSASAALVTPQLVEQLH